MSPKGVFLNIPAQGHVNPTLAVVKELVLRGHEIDYYCTEEFREKIEQAGARFRVLGDDLIKERHLRAFHLLAVFADLTKAAYQLLPDLWQSLAKENYNYVLVDVFTPWGPIVAEKLRLPRVIFYPCFALHKSLKLTPHFTRQLMQTPLKTLYHGFRLKRYFNKIKKKHQIQGKKISDYLMGPLLTPHPVVVFTSRTFQPQGELFPKSYHFVGASIGVSRDLSPSAFPFGALESLEGKQVVCFSLGSLCSNPWLYRLCIRAFTDTPYLVVLNISPYLKAENFPTPPNIIVCNQLPQLKVLAKASAFITHGGLNSVHEGIHFGVPLIIVPQTSDQFLVAQSVAANGLGLWLGGKSLSPQGLLQAVTGVIGDDTIASNLKAMRQSFKQAGGYKEAANTVERLVKEIPTPF